MKLAVVVPCYRQERWLERTVAALEHALRNESWEAVLVMAAPGGENGPELNDHWRVIEPPVARPLTPGAARMLGLSATRAPWVLFCDADVEVMPDWMRSATELSRAEGAPAGMTGRLEEWFEERGRTWPGMPDLYRVGSEEREVAYAATLAFYRREDLIAAGGYDPRLSSEEDYELGMRLRRTGARLVSLGALAGRHWSAPRPSWAELIRRWRTGLCFGQGQVLRLYWGRPGLGELLLRQRLYVATLVMGLLGVTAALVAARDPRPLWLWLMIALGTLFALAWRKRSLRLALYSLLTWSLNATGMVAGFMMGPRPPARTPDASGVPT